MPNPSFEEGSNTDAYFWLEAPGHIRDPEKTHTGDFSIKSSATSGVATMSDPVPVQPGTLYILSGWVFNSLTGGGANLDLNDVVGECSAYSGTGGNDWEYVRCAFTTSPQTNEIRVRLVTDGALNGEVWFDDIKLELGSNPPADFITVSGKGFLLNGEVFKVKGSNFSPPYYNWPTYMNEIPNENAERQFSEAKKFNINVIRLPTSYIGLGKDQVTEADRNKLRYYLDLAAENNFKLIISFFPDGPSFAEIKDPTTHIRHKNHLEGIIPYFKDDPRIFAWEVANELLNPVVDSREDRLIMIAWAREMANFIRLSDSNHMVTVGGAAPWTFGDHPEFSEFIDFVPLHYYPDWPMNPPDFFEQMVSAMRNLGYNQPLLIEEYGYPTCPHNETNYQKQREFYARVCAQVKGSNEVTGMINWSIQDANIDIYPHDDWHNQWGLIKSDFSWKPSASAFRDCDVGQCSLRSRGDTNCDNRMNSEDLELLKEDYLVDAPVHNTDFNSDGRVDCEDFAILQANYSAE